MKDSGVSMVDLLRAEAAEEGFLVSEIRMGGKHEYKVRCTRGKESFVIKAVDKKGYFFSEINKTFYNNEAKVAGRVKNGYSHLCAHHGFIYTKHFALLVYSQYQLGTVGEYFSDQQFNLLQTIIILKDLFLGIEELKTMGFVHKFFHEGNIFVTNQTLKVGGFEYCEKISAHKLPFEEQQFMLNTISSNLQSIPPEVILNKSTGVKSSMYCLGALLFKLLYKRPHFPAKKLIDVENQYKQKTKIDFPNDLPPDFMLILRRLLEYDSESRMSPYEFKQELGYLLSFCKNFEEDIRQSVYYKKTILGFKNIELRELKNIELDNHTEIEEKSFSPQSKFKKDKPEVQMEKRFIEKRTKKLTFTLGKDTAGVMPYLSPIIRYKKDTKEDNKGEKSKMEILLRPVSHNRQRSEKIQVVFANSLLTKSKNMNLSHFPDPVQKVHMPAIDKQHVRNRSDVAGSKLNIRANQSFN